MQRYWVSWWSGNYEDEGCTVPPFQFWVSGQKERPDYGLTPEEYQHYCNLETDEEMEDYLNEKSRDDCSLCACIDANSEDQIWEAVARHYPDYEPRFCEEREKDYNPSIGGRFQGFENRTSLIGEKL